MTADWGLRTDDQRLDSSTNLLCIMGPGRRYDPALGRFLSADTVVPGAGHPQALNRFSYVLNNPLRYTDPTTAWAYVRNDVLAIFTRHDVLAYDT